MILNMICTFDSSTLQHIVTNLLSSNPYVIVISLDFSKAFDRPTVRHSTLLSKIAQLNLPDHIYNWLVDFFAGHSHCTSFSDQISEFASINASIIQGSAIMLSMQETSKLSLRVISSASMQMIRI